MNTDTYIDYLININNTKNNEMEVTKNSKQQYNKEYYNNRHGFKNRDNSIICNICGGYWKLANKWRHINTIKHQREYSKTLSL
jgi:hypothetical protein